MGFRVAQVANLARQMAFTPNDQRLKQIAAAEELLRQIDPLKAYPFDFLVFRITGYHPKPIGAGQVSDDEFAGQLLTGLALQHDLGLLIEDVSDSLNMTTAQTEQAVLTIDEVGQKFNVSEKSIQRFRRRGLAARRLIFPDGKRRVCFLAGSVEQFFSVHRDGLTRTANFAPISEEEKQQIARRAVRLIASGCWMDEVHRRIGRKLNRSPLTIEHVLRELSPLADWSAASEIPGQILRDCIGEAFDAGASLSAISALIGRPRYSVYRILLERRLEVLDRAKMGFFDDPLYHQPGAAHAIDDIASSEDRTLPAEPIEHRVPRDVPAYFQDLYRYPLLSPARERALFLKMHFHRFQFTSLSRSLEAQKARWRDLEQLQAHLDQAVAAKNEIVAANLRLVVSIARKHVRADISLMDLVSDGNLALMRAADNYDFHRGNRFSTYASLALMKEFARAAARRRRSVYIESDVADERSGEHRQLADQHGRVQELLARLPEREQAVLRAHFGISAGREAIPVSLEQIGKELGLTKQRVRQIELEALAKLRHVVIGNG